MCKKLIICRSLHQTRKLHALKFPNTEKKTQLNLANLKWFTVCNVYICVFDGAHEGVIKCYIMRHCLS